MLSSSALLLWLIPLSYATLGHHQQMWALCILGSCIPISDHHLLSAQLSLSSSLIPRFTAPWNLQSPYLTIFSLFCTPLVSSFPCLFTYVPRLIITNHGPAKTLHTLGLSYKVFVWENHNPENTCSSSTPHLHLFQGWRNPQPHWPHITVMTTVLRVAFNAVGEIDYSTHPCTFPGF